MTYSDDFDQVQRQVEDLDSSFDDKKDDGSYQSSKSILNELLQNVCKIVQKAADDDHVQPEEMSSVLERASDSLEALVDMAYDRHDLCDFLPSYAHVEGRYPLVKDPIASKNVLAKILNTGFMDFFADLIDFSRPDLSQHIKDRTPEAFNSTPKPHSNTSPIARFRTENPIPTVPTSASVAQAVLLGCCSLMSDSIHSPTRLHTALNSDILVFAAAGGYKNRDPVVNFYRLDSCEGWGDFPEDVSIENGLLDIVYDIALDPSRRLIYAADSNRIKSYGYKDGEGDEKSIPVHTLKCSTGCSGPLAIVDHGARLLRAGKGGVDVWNVDGLPTHGQDGNKRIGKGRVNVEDTWRDDVDETETSTGSPRDSSINFADQNLEFSSWHFPSQWSTGGSLKALCFPKKTWSTVLQMDLEHGGKIASRYLGHAGEVYSISSSEHNQNTFMTTAGDGIVRLFDIREPLPRLSFDSGNASEHTYAALYVHVEGIPIVLSGGDLSQLIKVWDVRVPNLAYELATGNNSVTSLAWDAPRSTLYAATECHYMDRLGYHHDYRQARIKHDDYGIKDLRGQAETKSKAEKTEKGGSKDEDEDMYNEDEAEEEEEDEDEFDEEKCWPKKAAHDERYFGYAFDSGDHVLLRYKFGLDADLDIIPAFGMARLDRGSYW